MKTEMTPFVSKGLLDLVGSFGDISTSINFYSSEKQLMLENTTLQPVAQILRVIS